MIEFLKYWLMEYKDADTYGKFLIASITFCLITLVCVLSIAITKVTTEERRLTGKVYIAHFEARSVALPDRDVDKMVSTEEKP